MHRESQVVRVETDEGTAFGIIEKVIVDLSGERHIDAETETKMIMKRQ